RHADELAISSGSAHLLEQAVGEGAVHVVAAEGAVAARRLHLEDAAVEQEDGDVEGASAKIVDGEEAVLLLLEAIREGGRRGLVEQAEDVEPGEAAGVLRFLSLGV